MKRILAILSLVSIVVNKGCGCTKWKEGKDTYGYWYVVDNWKRIDPCRYVNPFDKSDTVVLGTDRKFHRVMLPAYE